MMKTLRLFATLMTSFVTVLAMSTSPECWAIPVYFDGSTSTDFQVATNWSPDLAPDFNLVDIYSIDDGLSSTFSSGTTTVKFLRIGSADKTHPSGENHFGRLTMTGGSLEVIGVNSLALGRENQFFYPAGADYDRNGVVDAADYPIWRKTLGSTTNLAADGDGNGTIELADYTFWRARFGNQVKGGEIIMNGSSTLKSNGALIGERTLGLLSIGPNAVVDIRIWDTAVLPNQFGGTEDMRIGGYGEALDDFGGNPPGLDGRGLVNVQGTLNAKDLYVSEHGAKGEIRALPGGTVNLNGALIMSACLGCVLPDSPDNIALLALQSSKVSTIGSSGTFNVGLDPDPLVLDPSPCGPTAGCRDIRSTYPATATFSFTADAGGVSPIVVVDNGAELSGTANIAGMNLVLNLDAYTSASPLTLINAAPGHLPALATFGTVTFLGSRTATVNYDVTNGDVFLNNFHTGAGAGTGSLAGSVVPEPSGLLLMMLTLGLLLFSFRADVKRQSIRLRKCQCLKVRA